MYVMGVDVGGSKTHCVIADENGISIAEGFGRAGNYQVCGVETASDSMCTAVEAALQAAGASLEDIAYAVFGISGADEPEDFEVLTPMVRKIMGDTPFQIVHDAWIGLRTGTEDYVGVVSICGMRWTCGKKRRRTDADTQKSRLYNGQLRRRHRNYKKSHALCIPLRGRDLEEESARGGCAACVWGGEYDAGMRCLTSQ